jgi:hypothetical protein
MGTEAVPLSLLNAPDGREQRSLCPACSTGYLHPYKVHVDLGGFGGYRYGSAWVAVCSGANMGDLFAQDFPPCGFSLPITPNR